MGITERLSTAPAQAPLTRLDPQGSGGALLDSGKIADILASIGEVPYEWDICADVLVVGRDSAPSRHGSDREVAPAAVALLCDGHAQ